MENYLLYLAPCVAVAFFVLLGMFAFCFYYYKSYNSKERKGEDFHEQQQQHRSGPQGHFVEKGGPHSAMNGYFVVVHL